MRDLEAAFDTAAVRQEKGELPSKTGDPKEECPAPLLQRKSFKALGTPTVQAAALSNERIDLTADEVLAEAVERRKEVCVLIVCVFLPAHTRTCLIYSYTLAHAARSARRN